MPDSDSDDRFPSSKIDRGKIFAKTGLKVGANYARYLKDRVTNRSGDKTAQKQALNTKNAEDIYQELTKLRGTALKLAQSMSMDTGMLPDEFMDVMAQAQYKVPPMNQALVRKRIRDGLGRFPEQLFDTFQGEAMAAASIGQVHRATLSDGRDVAVKVQYPNIRNTIESDLKVARPLIGRLVKGPYLDEYFEEIRSMLMQETDYENEADNIEFFADQYDYDDVVTPRAVYEYTSETVLTMTHVAGEHMNEFLAREPGQERRNHFGQLLWDFVHDQIASNYCTLHADAHPGNFLFRDDGRLGVIDFGCVKRFPQAFRDNMLRLWNARIQDDEATIHELLHTLDILHSDMNAATRERVESFFQRFGRLIVQPYRSDTFDFGDDAFYNELKACFREGSKLRETSGSHHFIFINKVLVGLFGIMNQLKPKLNTARSRAALRDSVEELPTAP